MTESKDLPTLAAQSSPGVVPRASWAVRLAPPAAWLAGIVVLKSVGLLGWAIAFGIIGGIIMGIRTLLRKIESSAAASHEKDPVRLLERALSHCQYTQGLEGPATRAVNQLGQLRERREVFLRILGERLDRGELTFGRYSGALEQVAQGVFDALHLILEELNGLASQNTSYAEERIKLLERAQSLSEGDKSELETLRQRLAIRDAHLATVSRLLTENERALTELDRAIAAITGMKAGDRLAPADLDAAMKDLEEISARARRSNPAN